MKVKSILLSMAVVATLLSGCGANNAGNNTANNTTNNATESKDQATDVVTTASIVDNNDAFEKAISANGTWIVATLNDLTFDKEIVMDGEFHNKGDASKEIYRKLAIYAQDEDHNVTERYTLTVPKLTVKSENAKIQGGTVKGDVYVEAKGFVLSDAKIDGNLYFASQEAKDSYKTEKDATVTGKTEVATDAVTTASIVNNDEAFAKAISADGNWIIAILNDVTTDKDLVVDGEFHNKGDASKEIYRKIALYAQDENHNITASYTLTAPKLTIKSENTRLQGGTFVGDVYVEANGFNLSKAKIDGNVYFATQEAKDSFKVDENSSVTGTTELQK